MKLPTFLSVAAALLCMPAFNAIAGDGKDILEAQALYEDALKAGLGEPYLAPLHTDPFGPVYLWGGLDPIEMIKRHDGKIETDPDGTVYISRTGGSLGDPANPLQVPIYDGGPTATAIFKSAANRATYEQMVAAGDLMVVFGLNCCWGIVSGPAFDYGGSHSHWAQPGLGSIVVQQEKIKGKKITFVGTNLYSRGSDWTDSKHRWKWASEAFLNLLSGQDGVWDRKRPYMPVLQVN